MYEKKLKKLLAILKEENLDEIEVKSLFSSVRVARRKAVPGVIRQKPYSGDVTGTGQLPEREEGVSPDSPSTLNAKDSESKDKDTETIFSPMVGTYYGASAPEKDPLVSVGKRVKKGDVICIIEAMKLMNEIEAESDCIIRKILAEDSQPVEYGQPLFHIQPI
ncbi:MAG: acetyl-CoA carboxylase biotin carboxyl carrier protein [Candidatus Krumholzibacteriota bacterium]|nr:acetyl-CoA carboxylase biotin carboxyl carrier protein [Candidatus Krumholzibacteriota bacterium]